MATNVGSLGKTDSVTGEVTPEGRTVRQQLADTLARASNVHGKVDALMIQECGYYDVTFPPHFPSTPVATSEHVLYGKGQNGVRGTCIYTNNDGSYNATFDRDTINEISAAVCFRKNCAGQKVPVALVNCYRNQSANFERSTEQTVQAVSRVLQHLRSAHQVRQYFVQGDFNDEHVSIPGLERRHNSKFYHKKHGCRKTYIDLTFTNIPNSGFLEVYESCENVHGGEDVQNKSIFGHKTGLFWIGVKPKKPEKRKINVVSLKKLKGVADDFKDDLLGTDKDPNMTEEQHIEKLAKEISNKTRQLAKKAEISIIAGKRKNDHVLMRAVEDDADTNYKSKTPYKPLYRLMARVKEGCSDVAATSRKPSNKDFQEKLGKKLDKLNVADRDLLNEQIRELFPIDRGKKGIWYSHLKKFKKLVLSTSNSGALDYMGMSLRFTRIIFGHNDILLTRFQHIASKCFEHGYFPYVWRQDQITFLYKNKGDYNNADNWRPITISPSLGKHLEKVIVNFISNMDKKNGDNHAYSRGRSCLTAIVNVQGCLMQAVNPFNYNKNKKGIKEIVIISTDDIKSAFESVDHYAVAEAISRAFAGERCKIGQLITTYLDRRSDIVDNKTGEKLKLEKRYKDKTAPQGSLLSPFLWLIFDGQFTNLYKKLLKMAVEDKGNSIVDFFHVSYADDHLTILKLEVPDSMTEKEVCIEIRQALTLSRELIIQATTRLGCGVNPAKSENIIPVRFHEAFKKYLPNFEIKQTYKWLGYHLTLTNTAELKFDRKTVLEKFKKIRKLRDSVYQYTTNKRLRLKIYRTYFAPFVELYLPIVVQSADKNSEVHRFQHDCLCRAIEVCFTASRKSVEAKLKMLSVDDKAVRMAKRISSAMKTHELQAEAQASANNSADVVSEPRTLRSGKTVEGSGMARVNNNYIVRLNRMADSRFDIPTTLDSKLDMKEITRWVNMVNKTINVRIRSRQTSTVLARARARRARVISGS